jgi:hypothetical protein
MGGVERMLSCGIRSACCVARRLSFGTSFNWSLDKGYQHSRLQKSPNVIPAKAGIQVFMAFWTPSFAGETVF